MTVLRAVIEEGRNERVVGSIEELSRTLDDAATQARDARRLNIVVLHAPSGDNLFLVVGGDETVAGFNYGHGNPPYYASKGRAPQTEPFLTAFLGLVHHTEFPRRWVIPMDDGLRAALEFLQTGRKPTIIEWTET